MNSSASTRLDGAAPSKERPGRSEIFALAGILVLAFLLRLPYLGRSSLWLDEMWSVATSRMPWRSVLSVILHQDSNASLYYVLLYAWLRLADGVAMVRLPSVIAAVVTVAALYGLGRRIAGARVGLLAALLLAVNGFHVEQSQQARTYGLAVLLATLSTWLFAEAVEAPSRRKWLGYVLVSALAVYAHAFAVLVLLAHGTSLLVLPRRDPPWRWVLASAAAVALLVMPVAVLLGIRMREPMAPLAAVAALSTAGLRELLARLVGNTAFVSQALSRPVTLAYGLLFTLALIQAARAIRSRDRSTCWRHALLLSWLLVPVAITVGISIRKPILVPKYLLVCQPALALLAAVGIASIGRAWLRTAASVAVPALALLGLPQYYRYLASNVDWPEATAHILERARPGDAAIFHVAPGWMLFDYYRAASPAGLPAPEIVYPECLDRDDPRSQLYMPPLRPGLLERVGSRNSRVWLVLHHEAWKYTEGMTGELQRFLGSRYVKAEERQFDGYVGRVLIQLYVRETARAGGSEPAGDAAR